MKLRLLICIYFICLLRPVSYCQDSIRCGSWITTNIHYGFIIPPAGSSTQYLIKSHVPGVEVDYIKRCVEGASWNQAYHYPETGVAFFYAWLGNPSQLGNMMGVYPFINFHLQRSNSEILYLRLGIGLGYLPVTYDRISNHKDYLIGSHLNAMINLRLTNHFYLSKNLRLETGLGLTHCSDGTFKTPNLGINLVTVNTGLSYSLSSCKTLVYPFADTIKHKKFDHEFFFALGSRQIEPPGGNRYYATTMGYTIFHKMNSKNKLGLGVDFFYNNANTALYHVQYNDSSAFNAWQVGAKICYEIVLGKVSLPIEVGGYLHTQYTGNGYEYDRIGIRYYACRHVIINLTLLAHAASADYIEWGIGFKL
ncbi:MAG TPA: acyloxyacyl hydrolase [Bacteroidia bacterium]|jgi:hypothetical protein|nr:acyloxyacyl hydrolase [Bacteroidia bacterium]